MTGLEELVTAVCANCEREFEIERWYVELCERFDDPIVCDDCTQLELATEVEVV